MNMGIQVFVSIDTHLYKVFACLDIKTCFNPINFTISGSLKLWYAIVKVLFSYVSLFCCRVRKRRRG